MIKKLFFCCIMMAALQCNFCNAKTKTTEKDTISVGILLNIFAPMPRIDSAHQNGALSVSLAGSFFYKKSNFYFSTFFSPGIGIFNQFATNANTNTTWLPILFNIHTYYNLYSFNNLSLTIGILTILDYAIDFEGEQTKHIPIYRFFPNIGVHFSKDITAQLNWSFSVKLSPLIRIVNPALYNFATGSPIYLGHGADLRFATIFMTTLEHKINDIISIFSNLVYVLPISFGHNAIDNFMSSHAVICQTGIKFNF